VAVDRGDDFGRRDAELVCRTVDDALVGLVGNEPIDVGCRIAGGLEAASTTSVIIATAWRNTSRPSMRKWPTVPVEDGPPST